MIYNLDLAAKKCRLEATNSNYSPPLPPKKILQAGCHGCDIEHVWSVSQIESKCLIERSAQTIIRETDCISSLTLNFFLNK